MADWFGQQGVEGYQPSGGEFSGWVANERQLGGINPQGAASDPFAYTNGSLLTPFTENFSYGGGTAGAYTPPEIAPFNYQQFNYSAPSVPRIQEMSLQERPDFAFQYNPAEDPSTQFRFEQGQQALENGAAARGTLLTGGFQKALQDYGQRAASQEYQNAYGRALQGYQTNLNKEFGTFDRNWGSRLGAGQANIQAALGEGQLGLQGAQFNYGIARQGWQDGADAQLRAASAASSNSASSYSQALNEYKMRQGLFFENQDRQLRALGMASDMDYRNATLGMNLAGQNGASLGSIYAGSANAQAAAQAAQGQAWANGINGAGNAAMGYYYNQQPSGGSQPYSPYQAQTTPYPGQFGGFS